MQAEGAIASDALASFERYLADFLHAQLRNDPVAQHLCYHFGLTDPASARRGKRVRPRLTMAAAAALGASAETTFPACCAIELLHNYSLIHDDIEDADTLRHGRQTVWAAFGLAHGINAGDAVGALAHIALEPVMPRLGASAAALMGLDLARANFAMCQGQALDLALEGGAITDLETYRQMIEGKTAALFACACALGARCAGAAQEEVDRCRAIGCSFGMGFQIADDLSGIWGATAQTGKAAGGDLARRKKTYPVVWAQAHGVGRVKDTIARTYASAEPLSDQGIAQLRDALTSCGAYEAAQTAADNYFESALEQAAGLRPLRDALETLRSNA
ncbi:MAG: polyprenyl synthetase family protein [Candidatus Eremiobacteraeota bacterium]|nr:polyprenyl synthetase family protein [Candidatus Eremiobacteraeota bacterium]